MKNNSPLNPSPIHISELQEISNKIRASIIETSFRVGLPHLGSCLSCVDLLVVLYFYKMRLMPHDPNYLQRDRFILSKGHAAPALFQVLALKGFYSKESLDTYGVNGSIFGEHPPSPSCLPGIEAATGSLGHGMSIALGMALASRVNNMNYSVYTILGDGECNEGTIWECAMLSAAQRVSNMCVIIDFNKWQATDRSSNVMEINPMIDKWVAFGWDAIEIDGHNYYQLLKTLDKFPAKNGKPLAIIANTIKGKGVSFMEDNNNWHYKIPTREEVIAAKIELGVQL